MKANMNIVPFDSAKNLPAYLTNDASFLDINKEVVRAALFPVLSIKGMKFTINRDGVKTVVTKPDDADEVAQSLGVVFLRANLNAKTFYAKKYSEGESDNTRPDCYTYDGVAPSPNAQNPQATKCALCKNNQWGSKVSDSGKESKLCQDNARIAVSAPDELDPMLLRVPPKSLKPLREMLKIIAARKVPYNAVVVKVGFDRNEPSPVLTFKPVGLLDDTKYAEVRDIYDGETVRAVVGLDDFGLEPQVTKAPPVDADELDAALAARDITRKAAAKPEPKPAPVTTDDLDDIFPPTKKAKPAPAVEDEPAPPPPKKAKAAPVVDEDDTPTPPPPKKAKAEPAAKKSMGSDLLADLDDLLGNKDD